MRDKFGCQKAQQQYKLLYMYTDTRTTYTYTRVIDALLVS